MDLILKWFSNRGYKTSKIGLLYTISHKDMYGQMVCLLYGSGSFTIIWVPKLIPLRESNNSKDKAFNDDIRNPEFFPNLELWLKETRKRHKRRT